LQNLQVTKPSGWSAEVVIAAIEKVDYAEDASLRTTADRIGTDVS
jgi:hypothetical protein